MTNQKFYILYGETFAPKLRSWQHPNLLCLKSTALMYDECPETLWMDLMRLLTFQNQAQRLAVVGATIVVLQQVLAQHGLGELDCSWAVVYLNTSAEVGADLMY